MADEQAQASPPRALDWSTILKLLVPVLVPVLAPLIARWLESWLGVTLDVEAISQIINTLVAIVFPTAVVSYAGYQGAKLWAGHRERMQQGQIELARMQSQNPNG